MAISGGIGFGPQFATRVEHIEIGVRKVASGLILPPGAADDLLAAFAPAHRSGNPREELKAVQGVLGGRTWTWTWMLTAADRLMEIGIWPWWWDRNGFHAGGNWSDVPEATQLELLVQSLWAACYVARDEAQMRHHMAEFGWPVKLRIGREECQAEAYFFREYAGAIEAGDYRVRPPFFPLDQCRLWPNSQGPSVAPGQSF
jgi:hypothetical protein